MNSSIDISRIFISIAFAIGLLASVIIGSTGLAIPTLATTEQDTTQDLDRLLEDEDTAEDLQNVLEDDEDAREELFELLEDFDGADDESVQELADFVEKQVG